MYATRLYRNFYKGGSTFNVTLDLNADNLTGSQHTTYIMSGCYITDMSTPSELEGVSESSITIRPQSVTGSEWNSFLSGGIYGPF